MRLRIDDREVDVAPGSTILDAARQAGVSIPTLCHRNGHTPITSCFVCVVRVNGSPRLSPSCSTRAAEGMVVASDSPDVREARRTALELMFGDHLGDCLGPCQSVCPAHMDIPAMIRYISAGQMRQAIVTVKEKISLPAVLGRICPEICEGGCRRGNKDAPVAVCLLKRHAADIDLLSDDPYLPPCEPSSGKRAAILGTGPAGLSAAYYLQQAGVDCDLFDSQALAGGMLRYGVGQDRLPWEVLDAEIGIVSKLGAAFHLGEPAFDGPALLKLRDTFDAVLLATGPTQAGKPLISGLAMAGQGVKVDRRTLATNLPGFFAAGAVVTPTRHAVRSVAAGRLAALGIVSSLTGASVVAVEREFTVRMGKVEGVELDRFMATAVDAPRAVVSADRGLDLTSALTEANRCMHCDCRKKQTCSLRDFAIEYAVDPRAYAGERREFEQDLSDSRIVFEPGKCIACGICVHVAGDGPIGLAFNGRGFHVRVTTPFHASLSDALGDRAGECVESCPTGALAWR